MLCIPTHIAMVYYYTVLNKIEDILLHICMIRPDSINRKRVKFQI